MKKYSILFCLFLQMALAFAQAPEKMSYQAVVRNNNNVLVSNHIVGMRISILQGSATGTAVYTETQTPTTNANGLIAIEIGTGTVITGTFTNIDWANGPYFVKTETDPNGGTAYSLTSTNQLLSVPYALHAKTALNGVPSGSQHGQTLTNCDGNIVWTYNGQCPAKIDSFNCSDTNLVGVLVSNSLTRPGTTFTISYNGGNGGVYNAQSIASTGITGLQANLIAGTLNYGVGFLKFSITGTPSSNGLVYFTINLGGISCTIKRSVLNPATSIYCNDSPTIVLDVTNPLTGKTWMDRNLGAIKSADSSNDVSAYGDLYQWGRRTDGHQCRNSLLNSNLSSTDLPNHSDFILAPNYPYDWRLPQNEFLWQGVNGLNNPCPTGYRLPTKIEWDAEINSWSPLNYIGAFNSVLKLPVAGMRDHSSATTVDQGLRGRYWSSTVFKYSNSGPAVDNFAYILLFHDWGAFSFVSPTYYTNASGFSVRCIKD